MEQARRSTKESADLLGVHLLDDTSVTIGGVQVYGSTLWTDFNILAQGDLNERNRAMAETGRAMNDFHIIRAREDSAEIWTPEMARLQHFRSRFWLDQALSQGVAPQVVVSHHAPHRLSIAPQFARDLVSAGFVSDLSELIVRYQPVLWVHGHTHVSFDYRVGATNLRCNPRGYRHENVLGYDPGLVIEI